ncbi:dedicator of cytokinesis protein 7 isoform X2 [Episyrphus balteatus]|uniref:dedicator of cytokinesis protein 7 isoform X2 n=1 Tax=Episyrphus balteatus TaxID=286459 RepID=UPI0024867315|nr:dedicator of cytokinesis protein 7 isoform X2 [Episyrphus balteatus]
MSTNQRQFAQKLSKQQASEVRKNVVSCGLTTKPSDVASLCSSTICLTEPVEPLDYEEFLIQHSSILSREPLRQILEFPPGDVSVKTIPRKIRTVEHIVPKENITELPPHVQECVNCFIRPWKTVEYSQRHYSSSCCTRERIDRGTLSPTNFQQEFEIDKDFASFDDGFTDKSDSCTPSSRQSIASLSSVSSCTDTLTPRGSWASFDLRRSVNDPLIPNLLDDLPPESIDQANETRRQDDRQESLFSLYPEADPDDLIERRLPAEKPIEHQGHRIHVKCHQLRLELEVEPIFASMAIYDAKERKKISENFYFDMNSDNLKRMLNSHVQYSDVSTQSRTGIFEITYPSNDLFLVIRLEKVLQGDIKDSVEPYLKDDKDKYRDKAKSNASDYCERLGKYRMPFAWTGIYLTNVFNGDNFENEKENSSMGTASSSNSLDRKSSTSSFDQLRQKANVMSGTLTRRGSLERKSEKRRSWSPDEFANSIETFRPITITVSSFFKQESDKMKDEDLYKFLPELKRPAAVMKKYKCIPGSIKLEISPCPEDVKCALSPELAKVEPYPNDNTRPVKEILEFPSSAIYIPHYTYRNLLFIAPKELNFSSRAGSARNIAVRIQLMAGETQNDALRAIFAKSSCPEYSSEAFTAVNYHNKCPAFYDEIKVALPANIKQNHHLLFTLYHVSCQKKPQEMQTTVETPVGYTWIPLLEDGKLRVGEFNLPVMVETPPENYSFIPPNVHLPGTKWLDNHRPVFTVTIDAVTSIHTLDPYLDRFFLACEFLESKKVPPHIGEGNMEKEMKKCLLDIENADREPLVKNLPIVLDKLIELLVTTYKISGQTLSMGSNVFEVLCMVSENLSILSDDIVVDQYGRQSLLSTYVQYQTKILHPFSGKRRLTYSRSNAEEMMVSGYDGYVMHEHSGRSLDRKEITAEISPSYIGRDGQIRLLHEELALHWVVASGNAAEMAMKNSWFLFELMIKSMIEHLDLTRALTAPRKSRFPHQFTDDISTLIHLVTTKVVGYHNIDQKLAQSLNASLGFFIFDLFNIMDRGFVFGLIKTYYKVLISKNSSIPDLMHYKVDFLRIVCSHEHYIALNLPFATPYTTVPTPTSPTPSTNSNNSQNSYGSIDKALQADLNAEFRQQHYLVGLVLSELATVLEVSNPALHSKAIRCIRNLMTSHDLDSRYSDSDARARVASLYIPLLAIVMDTIPQLHQFLTDTQDRLHSIGLLEDYQGPHQPIATTTISPEVAYAISGSRTYSYVPDPVKNKSQLNTEDTRHLLACFIWVIKNLERTILYRWVLGLSPHRVHQMLQVLNWCIPCFEYRGQKRLPMVKRNNTQSFRKTPDMKEKLEEYIRGTGSARNDLINRRKDRNSTEKLRWRKDQMPYRSQFSDTPVKAEPEIEITHCIEGSLATELILVTLDALEIIVQVATNSEIHHNLLRTVLKVLLHALSRNQSTLSLQNLFASQRSLIFKFPNLLFDEETDICADLCLLLLKHCGSLLPGIRSQAAASLYLLMRQNFEIGNNFARVKMQVTMSLSSLVGTSSSFSEQSLRRALKTILVYAESDIDLQDTSFPEQVQDLLFNLHMILSDTVKMKEYQEDPEMLLDLMHRIAKGYQNNPDLRLTWLENMAKKHRERANHTEAAMCYVHSAALVAEYLSMLESQTHLPVGAVSFQKVTPNALMESAVSDDVLSPGEDGICLGNHFTEIGLKALLEEAANSFQIAGMYEAMNEVLKILIPICEANRDFQKLGKVHGKLQEAFNRIAQLQGKRVFGTYFRVGFYGTTFGDLDQQEFIYKEPTLTKLPEIFSRLQSFYADRFGPDSVHIIKDSNNVDVNTLDPDKAYIQITYVEPYFETFELRHRETYFERNFNIKRFIFATPFTKGGKAHGELNEQCKRKTILTTANHFPYVKTRIQVISRQQVILEPIEVAIEDIQKKTLELAAATKQEPADPKILQMVLQGCIGTTVNQGPMEMATVFLSGLADGVTIPTKHQNKLRLCFKEFAKRCTDALKKNRNLIQADQKDYQRELERNNERFLERLSPLITLSASQALGAVNANSYVSKSTPLRCVSDYFK